MDKEAVLCDNVRSCGIFFDIRRFKCQCIAHASYIVYSHECTEVFHLAVRLECYLYGSKLAYGYLSACVGAVFKDFIGFNVQ